eukprot:gene6506-11966_t
MDAAQRLLIAGGDPTIAVALEHLESQLRATLRVSVSTVKRRKKEYGIEIERSVSDDDLDKMVSATLARQPSIGVVMLQADLRRIERLRVDVCHCVTQLYIDLFEDLASLDCYSKESMIDMFCARSAFIPPLNNLLGKFKEKSSGTATENLNIPATIDVGPENQPAILNILLSNDSSELDLGHKNYFLLKSYFRQNPINATGSL